MKESGREKSRSPKLDDPRKRPARELRQLECTATGMTTGPLRQSAIMKVSGSAGFSEKASAVRANGRVVILDGEGCRRLADELGDTPETVICVHALARGSARAFVCDGTACTRGAVVRGTVVSLSHTSAITPRHADVGVYALEAWRGRGLSTAAAAIVARTVQAAGRIHVWSTGEDNHASLRVAQKLGFMEVSRRAYMIRERRTLL